MARVTLDDVSVWLAKTRVLDRICVSIPDGEFVAVLGPSGSGKSTLLRAIAGLVEVEHGSVRFDGTEVTGAKTASRDIGMVFQSAVLLPRRSVRGNIEFPLKLRRETLAAIRDRVNAEVRALHIEHLLERDPHRLSRGEEQLVQIARTMVRVPSLLLLDEPFASLDAQLRGRMRAEIRMLQRGYGVTTIMATNDPADALALASMVVVLGGEPTTVVQVGSTDEVHDDPVDLDVGAAMGPLWTLPVEVVADTRGFWLVRDGAVRLRAWTESLRERVGSIVTLGVRRDGMERAVGAHDATVRLVKIVAGGEHTLVCEWGDRLIDVHGVADRSEIGTDLSVRIDHPLLFDLDTRRRIA